MSFYRSISQCEEIRHAEKALLARWSSYGRKQVWSQRGTHGAILRRQEKQSEKEKWVAERDKGFLIEAVCWWKWVLACLGLGAWNQSAFKCGKEETLKSSPAPSTPLLCSQTSNSQSYLDGLLLWILMKENYKSSSFLNSLFTALHLSSCLHPSSHACKVCW